MSKYTWRQIQVWVGIETIRWTKSSNITWLPKTSFDFDDKIETKEDSSSLWTKLDVSDIEITREYAEWNIEMKAGANNIWFLLYSILGKKKTSIVVPDKVFSHIFTINNDSENPSLTIFTKEPNWDFHYPLALIESLTLSAQVWEPITITASFKSKKWVTDNLNTTYSTDYVFKAIHSKFKVTDKEADLNGARLACIESFELVISKENLETFCLNNWNEPIDILDGKIWITWSITAVFSDNDYKNKALNWREFALLFSLEDQTVKIWNETGKHPLLEFILPKVKFTDYGRDKDNDNLVKVNLNFKAFQNESGVEAIKVKLQNWVSNY